MPSTDALVDHSPPYPDGLPSPRTPLRHRRHGIFDIAFEERNSDPTLGISHLILGWLRGTRGNVPYARRLCAEIFSLAPWPLLTYLACNIWLSVSSALNLFFLSRLLNVLEDSLSTPGIQPEMFQIIAEMWLSFALISVGVDRVFTQSRDRIRSHLRAHFIPKLIDEQPLLFPISGSFDSEVPGWNFVHHLTRKMRICLTLLSQVVVLLYAISHKQSPEKELLMTFCIVHPILRWLAPSNGIGSEGYVFWTDSAPYKRLKALYGLAFSPQYRGDLTLDGVTSGLGTEYRKTSGNLGIVTDSEPYPWVGGLLRSWYWDFLINLTLDLPLAVYALTLPSRMSASSVTSMALLQQATNTLAISIGEYGMDPSSLSELFAQAKWLYDGISYESTTINGHMPYPTDKSKKSGMSISFRNVCLEYPGSISPALDRVSFDVSAGQLVLVVGANGSGKSSMLKLLARLFDPTMGEILIDGNAVDTYNVEQLRRTMVFLSQSPVIYPGTVRDNICIGLPHAHRPGKGSAPLDGACRKGGCTDFVTKLPNGYDTQLAPTFSFENDFCDGTYGIVSERLRQELQTRRGRRVDISGGQKQRLAAARTFMRMTDDTRLVVVDEATSSLDPVAERDLLAEFRASRNGRTMIFVTHRFHHLAREADQIICMREGTVVERGTHDELINLDGEYSKLYDAQS
ncbi:P-loop containing nucleoside triphosphate hydrolase protein [Coniophora puteana RWD-64-598 SS2]|uniref:p-loop containing nucleoside triphosphate hydrolase protein n=1 Tax=Coniophora puteana (strain RWD-64-598) TaxID=741705 RepID=R7SDN7_CONPW|nr:P-loop containing nucleoside triphosphate hydrolase protein [Coniophora puteana RWD-64-598 SS2]EIW73990.1 P-loop containing nucleoside triphosphate hydrolase protein [Coniophora puteana RWD-64-598 SS2]